MSIGQQILFLISALGAFNGFVLSIYIFLQRRTKSPAIYLLGIFLLALSVRVGISVLYYFNNGISFSSLKIYMLDCYLIGPSLYYFFRAVREKPTRAPKAWKWSWCIQLGVLVLTGILVPYQQYQNIWHYYIAQAIYIQWFIYLALSAVILKDLLRSFFTRPATLQKNERFLVLLFLGSCFISAIYLFAIKFIPGVCISGGLAFSLILYVTLTIYFYHAPIDDLFQSNKLSSTKPERKKLPENDAQQWAEQLRTIIITEALYKDPNLKLNELAKKINISTHQLSQLLNDYLNKSFSTYVNEYRIEEACKLIRTNAHFTFEAIGYEVGYNSKSTFYAVFKKIKGVTPALYKENMEITVHKTN